MKSPIEIEALPAALRKPARSAIDNEDWGDAIEAFEEWLDDKGKRPPGAPLKL